MSFKSNVISFVSNVVSLLKVITKQKIDWDSFSNKIIDCKVDKHTKIGQRHVLKNVEVGYGTYIGTNSIISYTNIGKFCSLGPNLVCGWGVHPLNGMSTSPVFYSTRNQVGFTFSETNKVEERRHIEIGNDVFIGANVTILDGVKISDGAIIGAGAIVSKDIPPYAIAVGVPIKIIKYRFSAAVIETLLKIEWWNKDEKTFKDVEEYFFDVPEFLNKYK